MGGEDAWLCCASTRTRCAERQQKKKSKMAATEDKGTNVPEATVAADWPNPTLFWKRKRTRLFSMGGGGGGGWAP